MDEGRGDLLRVAFQCAAAPACTEKDVAERQPILGAKALRVGCQIGRELFVARVRGSHVLGEKFHLLPHAPADDEVVAVKARRPAFAVENLVADVVLDEALQFLLGSADAARSARTRPQGWRCARAEMTIFAGASASFLPTRP